MPSLSQIALSVSDLERSLAWYERALGLRRSGSTRLFRGPAMERITGIPDPVCRCAWMVDAQRRFQLELFEFTRPLPRRRTGHETAVGYSTIAVSVPGTGPRVLTDPDGNRVQVLAEDIREPGRARRRSDARSPVVRGVGATVLDLGRSRSFFGGTLGLREARPDIGLDGDPEGAADRVAYWADDVLVELVERPDAADWRDGRCLSDIGILNIAFATGSGRSHRDLCRRIAFAGYRLTGRPLRLGLGSVVYATDDQGFSVELVHLTGFAAQRLGYLA